MDDAARQVGLKAIYLETQSQLAKGLAWLSERQSAAPTAVGDLLSLSLILVLDCTSSMLDHRSLLLTSLPSILTEVERRIPMEECHIGFVGYRDLLDEPRVFVHPPVPREGLEGLRAWVGGLPLEGGGEDIPEDLLGGLHVAQGMMREHEVERRRDRPTLLHLTPVILVIADAPCHGPGMHAFADTDEHLALMQHDPFTADSVLQGMAEAGYDLGFLRLNAASDPMLGAFRHAFDQPAVPHHMVVLDVSHPALTAEQRVAMWTQKVSVFLANALQKTLLRAMAEDAAAASPRESLPQSPNAAASSVAPMWDATITG